MFLIQIFYSFPNSVDASLFHRLKVSTNTLQIISRYDSVIFCQFSFYGRVFSKVRLNDISGKWDKDRVNIAARFLTIPCVFYPHYSSLGRECSFLLPVCILIRKTQNLIGRKNPTKLSALVKCKFVAEKIVRCVDRRKRENEISIQCRSRRLDLLRNCRGFSMPPNGNSSSSFFFDIT